MSNAKTVWKFAIDPNCDVTKLSLPIGAKPLSVDLQHNSVQMWCLCDPHETIYEERAFHLVGTGEHFYDSPADYIGTFQVDNGNYIWHLFEVQS